MNIVEYSQEAYYSFLLNNFLTSLSGNAKKSVFFPSDLYLATIQRLLKRKEDGCIWCG